MKAPLVLLAVLAVAPGVVAQAIGAAAVPSGRPGPTESEADLVRRAERVLDGEVARYGIPSACLALIKGDRVVLAKAYGRRADGLPADADMPFIIGSVSKAMTALGLLLLVDRGKVDLSRPVTDYLPGFTMADPRYRDIAVRDLLRHASGFSTRQGQVQLGMPPSTTIGDLVAGLKEVRLSYAPGTRYEYSNLNYVLVGALIEAVAGRPYAAYMEEEVFAPLGMTMTRATKAGAAALGLAAASRGLFGWTLPGMAAYPDGSIPPGHIATTAADFGRYLVFLKHRGVAQDGRRLLSEASFTAWTTRQAPGADYGYGWESSEVGIGHRGLVAGFQSEVFLPWDAEAWGWALVLGKADSLADTILPSPLERVEYGLFGLLRPGYAPPLREVHLGRYRLVWVLVLGLAALLLWAASRFRVASLLSLLLALGLLIAVPATAGPWPVVLRFSPDLSLLVGGLALGEALMAGLWLWRLLRKGPAALSKKPPAP